MAIISVYLQQATDVADHVLYGVVNAVYGSAPNQTISVNEAGNYGGSITNAIGTGAGPFAGAIGKVVRRYTGEEWNTKGEQKGVIPELTGGQRPYAVAANVGIIETVTNSYNSFTVTASGGISNTWAINDVWAIDYHSPYSFGKYSKDDSDKYGPFAKTADETKAKTTAGTGSDSFLPRYLSHPLFFGAEPTAPSTWQKGVFSKNGEQDVDPLTTKWELRCDTLGRSYSNSAIPLPIPSIGRGDQYFNMLLDIGMRQETINLTGTLVDRGKPTAENPRLQTLFDIVRTQHSSTLNLNDEDQGGDKDEGGKNSPANPLAYLRLTIGSGYEPSDYQESTGEAAGSTTQTPTYAMNTNLIVRDRNYSPGGPHTPAGLGVQRTAKAYRGLITQFSANLTGGKPDIWSWQMTFNVVKNEHDWTLSS